MDNDMKKRIAIVGFGEMGKRHALEFMKSTRGLIQVAGVVEPNDAMHRRGCEWTNQEPVRYSTVAEMLEKCRPDGAVISSPNHTHLENLRMFTGADIPILLEKPLEVSLEKVMEVVRFAKTYKGKILVDHVMRHAPIIRRAKQLIEDGKLGKICSFQFTQHKNGGAFHNFRRSRKGGGGQLIEKATHDLDVMLFLTNSLPARTMAISKQQHFGGDKPDSLRCSDCAERLTCPSASEKESRFARDINLNDDLCAYSREVDISDNELCVVELANGVFGTYSHNYFTLMPGHSRIYEVIGTEGALHMRLSTFPEHDGKLDYFPRDKSGEREQFTFDYFERIHYNGGPYIARHFLNLMTGEEKEPFTTVEQAFVAEALGFAAMKSAEEGSRFVDVAGTLPPDMAETYRRTYPGM